MRVDVDDTNSIKQIRSCLTRLPSENEQQQNKSIDDLARLLLPIIKQLTISQLRLYSQLLNRTWLADDLASQACWRAVRDIRALRNLNFLMSWLKDNVRWQITDHLRRSVRAHEILTDKLPELAQEDRYPAESIVPDLRKAVQQLRPELRGPVILYYWHGRNLAECAEHFGVREPAMSARLKKARRLVRRSLLNLGYTEKGGW